MLEITRLYTLKAHYILWPCWKATDNQSVVVYLFDPAWSNYIHEYTRSSVVLSSYRNVFISSLSMFSPSSCFYHPCGKRTASAPQRAQRTGTPWPPTGLWTTCTLLRMWASLRTLGESSISSVQIVRLDRLAGTLWMTRKVSMSLWKGWIMHSLNACHRTWTSTKCVGRLCIFSWIYSQLIPT